MRDECTAKGIAMNRATFTAHCGRATLALAAALAVAGFAEAVQEPAGPKKTDLIEQLERDFTEARARLQKDDAGAKTQGAHRRIIEGIDRLLEDDAPEKAPPSAAPSTTPRPKSTQPMTEPKPAPQATPGAPMPEQKAGPQAKPAAPAPSAEFGPWHPKRNGHAEVVDAAGRERFPPRYEELLRAYYRALAGRTDEP